MEDWTQHLTKRFFFSRLVVFCGLVGPIRRAGQLKVSREYRKFSQVKGHSLHTSACVCVMRRTASRGIRTPPVTVSVSLIDYRSVWLSASARRWKCSFICLSLFSFCVGCNEKMMFSCCCRRRSRHLRSFDTLPRDSAIFVTDSSSVCLIYLPWPIVVVLYLRPCKSLLLEMVRVQRIHQPLLGVVRH